MKRVPTQLAEKLSAHSDRFLADGAALRLDEVASAIEVPRATLYYYFSGKDDLVSFLMADKLARVAEAVGAARVGEVRALDRFCDALRAAIGELAGNPALCLNLMVAVGRMADMSEIMVAADRAVMGPLRELLIEARAVGDVEVDDIDNVVAGLMGGVNFAVVQRYAVAGSVDAEAMADQLVALALHGIRSR